MPVTLTPSQIRHLRGLAHPIKALLQVGGKGVTPALLAELDLALAHHELVKVKVAAEDRDARAQMIGALSTGTGAALVQTIGHTAVLYRANPDHAGIVLPR